jgi:hypothetical protein
MNGKESNPPRLAIWLMRHACPRSNNEALTGDLVERFREGRSYGWFWNQVLIAITVGVLTESRRHWPQVCYAITGTVMFTAFLGIPIFERNPHVLQVLAALPALAVALLMNCSFRWASLLRTGVISVALLEIPPILLAEVIGPHVIPAFFWFLLIFSTLLVSAWLGCRSPQNAGQLVVKHSRVVQRQYIEFVRHGEYDMKVAGGEKLALTSCEPMFTRLRLALRTVPVPARVIGDGLVTALRTGIDMTAQRSRAAALNGAKGLELLKVKAPSIPIQEAVALRAEDVGHLHGGPAHFCLLR